MTWSGSASPHIILVGEAWGRDEAAYGKPFVGLAGIELMGQLRDAGFGPPPAIFHAIRADLRHYTREEGFGGYRPVWPSVRDRWCEANGLAFTNVFNLRPRGNDITTLGCSRKELQNGQQSPSLALGRLPGPKALYLKEEFHHHLDRLRAEIDRARPNLLVPLGATACWAILGRGDIGNIRGTASVVRSERPLGGMKVLPTYHPSAIIRGRAEWRVIALMDLLKARRESETPDFTRPRRIVRVNSEHPEEIFHWVYLAQQQPGPLAVDIETAKGQITCISFASSPTDGLTIPFRNKTATANHWKDTHTELLLWRLVGNLLKCGRPLVFQNGMYDMQYLARMGFDLSNAREDTMLLAHSLFPELQKSLGFLGSIWTNEPSWKLMRKQRATKVKGDKLDE